MQHFYKIAKANILLYNGKKIPLKLDTIFTKPFRLVEDEILENLRKKMVNEIPCRIVDVKFKDPMI